MDQLTEFQVNCENKLNVFLEKNNNVSILNRNIKGEKEEYIHIDLNLKNIEIWIYKQECMFVCDGKDVHFEKADYSEKIKLIEEFIVTLERCILGKDISDMGSGFIKLSTGKKL